MAITPTGSPAWVKSNDHTSYGGHVNKTNYQSIGSVNPKTDLTAENLCRIAADLAALHRTAPFCVITWTCEDTVPAVPTVDSYFAMSGSAPTGVRNANGDVSFTWSASYSDEYSVSGDFNIIGAVATCLVSGSVISTYCEIIDSDADGLYDRIRCKAFSNIGAGLIDAQVSMLVWTG